MTEVRTEVVNQNAFFYLCICDRTLKKSTKHEQKLPNITVHLSRDISHLTAHKHSSYN